MQVLSRLCGSLCLVGMLVAASAPAAAAYPDRPIRLVIGMPPGGGADYVARLVVSKVGATLGTSVVVENKAGADGIIAAAEVAHAAPDGYTLAWITNSHVVAPLFHKLSYDPAASFAPVIQMSSAPDVMLVPKAFPADSLKQLIEMARAKPDSIAFGSAGLATPSSLEANLLMRVTDTKMTSVPYKGGSDAVIGVLNGSVSFYFATISTALSTINSGKVRPLAVTTLQRSALLPDVPTVAEVINYPTFEGGTWLGVLAPAGTPKAIVDKLNAAFGEAIKAADVKERLAGLGWTVIASTPQVFGDVIKNDIARWAAAEKVGTLK